MTETPSAPFDDARRPCKRNGDPAPGDDLIRFGERLEKETAVAQDARTIDRFRWRTAAELDAGEFEQQYLIPGILAEGQPGGIYGAFKALKTSIAIDQALSLATGCPFLGYFRVDHSAPVAFMSGESGLSALQSIARRVCRAKGCSLDRVEGFFLTDDLPRLERAEDIRTLERFIREREIKALYIDPAYLCMDIANDAHNIFATGQYLKPIGELCKGTGCAILLVHHNKRGVQDPSAPAQLSDISWSGFAEFSAQWVLLSRRSAFDPETGQHEIWLNVGGRAGHCGLYGVDIREGRNEDIECRAWEVEVHQASETRAGIVKADVQRREESKQQKRDSQAELDRTNIITAFGLHMNGETKSVIQGRIGRRNQAICPDPRPTAPVR